MGGIGSGNWLRMDGKTTVEQSLAVAVGEFHDRLTPGMGGTFLWTWGSGAESSISYLVTGNAERPIVELRYRWDRDDVSIPIRMQTTPTQFDGRRWWFTCPLAANGAACNRRVGKLYLPPGSRYFGCRSCHRLTYRSCQASHYERRSFGSIEGTERLLEWLNT